MRMESNPETDFYLPLPWWEDPQGLKGVERGGTIDSGNFVLFDMCHNLSCILRLLCNHPLSQKEKNVRQENPTKKIPNGKGDRYHEKKYR